MAVKLTRNDLILLAANKLPQPFSEEQLVVTVWEFDRDKFGLDGFKERHPNNNLVKLQLMGENGLIRRGELIKVSTGMYRVRTPDDPPVREKKKHGGSKPRSAKRKPAKPGTAH